MSLDFTNPSSKSNTTELRAERRDDLYQFENVENVIESANCKY